MHSTQPETPSTLREACVDDVSALVDLSIQLGYPSSHQQIESRLRAILGSPQNLVLVALDDSVVIAWIHAFVALRIESNRFAELGGLVVDETYRGQGVGRQLVEAVEVWAIGQGIDKLRVRSRSDRTASIAVYEHWGLSKAKEQSVLDKAIGKPDRPIKPQ